MVAPKLMFFRQVSLVFKRFRAREHRVLSSALLFFAKPRCKKVGTKRSQKQLLFQILPLNTCKADQILKRKTVGQVGIRRTDFHFFASSGLEANPGRTVSGPHRGFRRAGVSQKGLTLPLWGKDSWAVPHEGAPWHR